MLMTVAKTGRRIEISEMRMARAALSSCGDGSLVGV
jgi:hypothetical protein